LAFLSGWPASRAAEIIFTVVIVSIATGVLLLFMSGMGPLTNLKPVLERGWGPVFEAALTPIFFFATTSAMVLAFGKYVTEPSRMRRAVVAGLLIAGALLTSLSILAITSLGPHHVGRELTPLLALAKNVYIPGVIERSDLLLLGIWMLGVVFDVTVLLLAASIILGDAFGVSFRYVALALFFVGVPAVSLRVTDLITLPKVFAPLPAAIVTLAIYIGVVGLVYGAALVRGKGGTDG
jgi:spore germination protein KB